MDGANWCSTNTQFNRLYKKISQGTETYQNVKDH